MVKLIFAAISKFPFARVRFHGMGQTPDFILILVVHFDQIRGRALRLSRVAAQILLCMVGCAKRVHASFGCKFEMAYERRW